MNKFFISKNYSDLYTASSKAKIDVEIIAEKNSYVNIGLSRKNITNKFGRIWTLLSNKLGINRMPSNGIILVQYPSYGIENQIREAKKRGNKVVVVIHDINVLRNFDDNSIAPLYLADVLVAHNSKMKEWLIDNKFSKTILELEIFDYLSDNLDIKSLDFPLNKNFNICFAGNLKKSKFLNDLKFKNNKLRLFGIGAEDIKQNEGVEYIGCFSPEDLKIHLKSHFGLVWDGTSCETCDGITGEYLKFIAPHKLSMYLSSNLPVIVWSQSAMADFVKKYNVGVVVDNLHDIENILYGMTKEEYDTMAINARTIGVKLRQGYFTSKVLNKVDSIIE